MDVCLKITTISFTATRLASQGRGSLGRRSQSAATFIARRSQILENIAEHGTNSTYKAALGNNSNVRSVTYVKLNGNDAAGSRRQMIRASPVMPSRRPSTCIPTTSQSTMPCRYAQRDGCDNRASASPGCAHRITRTSSRVPQPTRARTKKSDGFKDTTRTQEASWG